MSFLRHGESIDPMMGLLGASGLCLLPALIGFDEFQPAIPWQVALQQSPPPLHRPGTILEECNSPYNDFSANGDNPLNSVSQPKGALHITHHRTTAPPIGDGGRWLRAVLWAGIRRYIKRRPTSDQRALVAATARGPG